MRKPRKENKELAFIATILLLIAIPISVFGTQSIKDIRNRAAETDVFFETVFEERTLTAYREIYFEKELALGGVFAKDATITLGCNPLHCPTKCDGIKHTPPQGLTLQDDNTLVWSNPDIVDGQDSWPIVLSAYTKDTAEDVCIVEQLNLRVTSPISNMPPQCEIFSDPSNLSNMPKDQKATFMIKAIDPDDGISNIDFKILTYKETVYSQSWDIDNEKIVVINKDSNPSLSYSFNELGQHIVEAVVTDASGTKRSCDYRSTPQINIVIPGDNGSPEFTTDPYRNSTPSTSIKTTQQYSYTLEARDPDGDDISYFIINETGWVNFNLDENENGQFKGTFSGTATKAGSYTIAVALNDGFRNHYSTQIWVINVDSLENDTPKVTIVKPKAGESYPSGDSIKVEWDAKDDNLITKFDVFLSTDPTNRSTWKALILGLGYNYNSYIWPTGSTPIGTYYIVVEATDNQTPSATGKGISSAFNLTEPSQGYQPPPPEIPESYPRITNVKPPDRSKTSERRPLISADLTASTGNTVKEGSVSISLDDKDVTENADIRGAGLSEGSIIYTPKEPLSYGSHKISVSFRDTSDKVDQKSWTFTIEKEDTEAEAEDEDTDVINIFGFKLPKRVAVVAGVGLALLLLAILIPWLFYAAWRRSADDDDDIYVDGSNYPYSTPPQDMEQQTLSSIYTPPPPPQLGYENDQTYQEEVQTTSTQPSVEEYPSDYYTAQEQGSDTQDYNSQDYNTQTSEEGTQEYSQTYSQAPINDYNQPQQSDYNPQYQSDPNFTNYQQPTTPPTTAYDYNLYNDGQQVAPPQNYQEGQDQAISYSTDYNNTTNTVYNDTNEFPQPAPIYTQDLTQEQLTNQEYGVSQSGSSQPIDNNSNANTSQSINTSDNNGSSNQKKEPGLKGEFKIAQEETDSKKTEVIKQDNTTEQSEAKPSEESTKKIKNTQPPKPTAPKTSKKKQKKENDNNIQKEAEETGIAPDVLEAFKAISPKQEESPKVEQPEAPKILKPKLSPQDIALENGQHDDDSDSSQKGPAFIVPPTKPPVTP